MFFSLRKDYENAIKSIKKRLIRRTGRSGYLFVGELDGKFKSKMDHLTCFLPGLLALGSRSSLSDFRDAEELLATCYRMYERHPSFLAPEITHFNRKVSIKQLLIWSLLLFIENCKLYS